MTTLAEHLYPNGLPGLLTVKALSELLGISRPTALSILHDYPDYTVKRGNTQFVSVGLYYLLARNDYTNSDRGE